MRSTGFVILSITFHCLAAMAIVLAPVRTVTSDTLGKPIEVKVTETADQPGVVASDVAPEDSKPEAIVKPVTKIEVRKPSPDKVVVKIKHSIRTKKAAEEQPLPKKENLDAAVDAKDTAPAAAAVDSDKVTSEDKSADKDESVKLIPIKEAADGVESTPSTDSPSADSPGTDEKDTEAKSTDLEKTSDPAPVAVTTDPSAKTGEVAKGGASKEGAVSYLDLKQLPGNQPPAYPLQARLDSRQGQVDLLYRVTKEGKVADVQVVKSSGSKDLDNEAVRAISKFRFVPGQEGWARHPVSFALKGPVATLPSQLRGKGAAAD